VQATSTSIGIPGGITIDAAGNLYIAGDNRILKVTAAGIVSTIAGNGVSGYSGDGGAAKSAMLAIPNDLAVDKAGNLFVTDMGNGAIRKIIPDGTISTIAGGVPGAVYTNL
jgi:sugar lactone lactonase YvrE